MIDNPMQHAQNIRLQLTLEKLLKRMDSLPQLTTPEQLDAIQTLLKNVHDEARIAVDERAKYFSSITSDPMDLQDSFINILRAENTDIR